MMNFSLRGGRFIKNHGLRTELTGTSVLPHGILLPGQQLSLLLQLKPLLLQLLQPATSHLHDEKMLNNTIPFFFFYNLKDKVILDIEKVDVFIFPTVKTLVCT